MHLQDHARAKPLLGELAMDGDHGELDQVGGSALKGRVERSPFGQRTQIELRRRDLGNRATPAEQRPSETAAANLFERAVKVLLDAAIAFEISGDKARGFFLIDAQVLRQSERRQPVN